MGAAILTVRPGRAAAGESCAAACGMTYDPGGDRQARRARHLHRCLRSGKFHSRPGRVFRRALLAYRRDHGGVAAIRQPACRTTAGGTAKIRPLHGSAFTVKCTSGNPAWTGPVTGYGSCLNLDDLDAPRERGTVR